jgi:hypothetical protein
MILLALILAEVIGSDFVWINFLVAGFLSVMSGYAVTGFRHEVLFF